MINLVHLRPHTASRKRDWRSLFVAVTAIAATSAAFLSCVLLASEAHSQTIDPAAQDAYQRSGSSSGWDATVGAGAIWMPKFEGADSNEVTPFPFLSIHYKDLFYIEGNEMGLDVIRMPMTDEAKFTFGPMVRYRRDRPEKRDTVLKGLGDVGTSLEAGAAAKLSYGPVWVRVSGGKDIADGHDGVVVQGELGASFMLTPEFTATVTASTNWADKKYMNDYFGVTPLQSAASGLASFVAKDGIKDATAGVALSYRLNSRWSIAATGSYTRLLNDAKDNPLVRLRGSADQFQGGAFLAYSF